MISSKIHPSTIFKTRFKERHIKHPTCDNVTIQLTTNSAWLSVGSWLFHIEHLPCSVSFWCMLGGCVDVWTNKFLSVHWGQTHLGIPRVSKTSLALNKPKNTLLFIQIQILSPGTYQKYKYEYRYCMQTNPWKNIRNQLPYGSEPEL
jgi:hypothetical protein